jgi:folate-binding protein YgfZ
VHLEDDGVDALRLGMAFVDLSDWRKVRVGGSEAVGWLHDLLTADVAGLEPGNAARSFLLSATGKIRADVHVVRRDDDIVLLQPSEQPDHVGLLLAPYTLSSDVELEDATASLVLFAIPGAGASLVGHPGSEPSVLGPGVDLLVGAGKPAWRTEDALVKAGLSEASHEAAEVWRILQGHPRMGADFGQGSLPAETGLDDVIDLTKGCFLGQESVAKVRNLGHPPWVLKVVRVDGPASVDDAVLWGPGEVGRITSAAVDHGTTQAVARIRWEAADQVLTLPDGRALDVGSVG